MDSFRRCFQHFTLNIWKIKSSNFQDAQYRNFAPQNPNNMRALFSFLIITLMTACYSPRLSFKTDHQTAETGEDFYRQIMAQPPETREKVAVEEILGGNMPSFLKKFTSIRSDTIINGKRYRMKLFVLADYIAIGNDRNFARIPLTPTSGQQVADSLHCFLPTKKIVDLIYRHATIKLDPVPMYALRDSSVTMFQHHLIIEGQRKLRKGLIAGIKKDVIITDKLKDNPGKVAIYGWHRLNGIPIQPVYTGHVDWYVDYSHGIRLVSDTIFVNGKKYHYTDILKDPVMRWLITDEMTSDFLRYPLPK